MILNIHPNKDGIVDDAAIADRKKIEELVAWCNAEIPFTKTEIVASDAYKTHIIAFDFNNGIINRTIEIKIRLAKMIYYHERYPFVYTDCSDYRVLDFVAKHISKFFNDGIRQIKWRWGSAQCSSPVKSTQSK